MAKETFLAQVSGIGPGLKRQHVAIPDEVRDALGTKIKQAVRVTINTDLEES
jgi:bifunctional DNA-binding transcriptional regulator/antitoxin component of YhaV-PrlF toxin-antitoxin module